MGGNKESIWLKKGKDKIVFDIRLITQKGIIFCIYFKRALTGTEISATVIKMNSGKAHDILGHCNHRATIEAIEALNWAITGVENKPCMHCTATKAKRKALNRTENPKTGRVMDGLELILIQ